MFGVLQITRTWRFENTTHVLLCVHNERYFQNAKLFQQIRLGCIAHYFCKQRSMTYILKNKTHVNGEKLS